MSYQYIPGWLAQKLRDGSHAHPVYTSLFYANVLFELCRPPGMYRVRALATTK
jgi:hypothetical protein